MKKISLSTWMVLLLLQFGFFSCQKESNDTTPPEITCPADTTLSCPGSILPADIGTPKVTDNSDPAPAVTFTDATNNSNPCIVVTTRTWTAMDNNENTNRCIQTITVHDITANFRGIWIVNENWTKLTYEVSITSDPVSCDAVYIENFAASGAGVKTHAIVSGNSITINPLPQTLNNDWVIESGSGGMQGTTKIYWNYKIDDQANTYTATATYTKK